MIKLAALNEDWSDETSSEPTEERAKESRESEALELYNQALQCQQQGNYHSAKEFYEKLLKASFVVEADEKEKDEDPQGHPGLALKYSAYKNLASLAERQSDLDKAVDFYLEAAAIDDSDVTLWYKIGKLAVKVNNIRLARYAFEQGLNCNSKHWPCLDELITVLYAIGDYNSCLVMVSSAFERDPSYPKGLILRDKIFGEYASFREDFHHLRGMIDAKRGTYDQSLASQVVEEAINLRIRNSQRNLHEEPPLIVPAQHLALYTWSSLGSCLVALYDQVTSDETSQSLCQKVNLEDYCRIIVTPEIIRHSPSQKLFMKENDDKRSSSGVKRKKPVTLESDPFSAPKRRSARVSKSKKKQEEVNYLEILQEFLPKSLRIGCLSDGGEEPESTKVDSQEDRYEKAGLISIQGISSERDASSVPDISGENEPLDVQRFVKKHMDNCGTIDLLCEYATHLTKNCYFKWSTSLVDVFLEIYCRLRPHLALPSLLCQDSSKAEIMSNAELLLVAIELTLDKWCTEKSKSSSSLSPAGSPRSNMVEQSKQKLRTLSCNSQSATVSPLKQDPKFHGKYFLHDLEYIVQAAGAATSLLERDGIKFSLRVNWAKVRFLMFQGQMNLAVIYLDRCKTLIELSETPISVHLVNCKADNIITIGQVRKKLESLQRCQSLEEVHRLYESGQYQEVVDLLLGSLHHPPSVTKVGNGGMSIPERPAQLLLLQDSLLKLKDYKTCLSCAEAAFNEAVGQMTLCEAWSTTLERLFQCMNTILSMEPSMLDTLPEEKTQRLTQNLVKVVEVSMETSDNASEVPLATAMPWVLLYRVIQSKEDRNDIEEMEVDKKPPTINTSEVATSESTASILEAPVATTQLNLPLSLQFLRLGHEALGGRAWCVNSDGIFLLLYVDVFVRSLKEKSLSLQRNREKLIRDLEQCFFCLYGHPSKKAKARGLQEHGSTQIALTWANAASVFEFFKPPVLPTFEDKANTVTSEVQNLFRRITLIIPQTEFEVISVESVQNFIEGSSDEIPSLPKHLLEVERPVTKEIFYLLADSYFKNKEFSKAIKFYIHDICCNPDRFDTWAAMALARQVRLEDKLRACEPKSEGPIQKHSVSTLRCFKRALQINNGNTNLWGEYGSLSYCLHSYASRQINQEEAPENQTTIEQRRTDMLIQAKKCFNEALNKPDNDEPWLQYYMLGKIAEKLHKPPTEYLESYLKAFDELDKDDAEYPRKITYHNPPNLALEALEVGFRFHASVLKLLMKPDSKPDYKLLEDYLDRASRCPFYQANAKGMKEDPPVSPKAPPEKLTVPEGTKDISSPSGGKNSAEKLKQDVKPEDLKTDTDNESPSVSCIQDYANVNIKKDLLQNESKLTSGEMHTDNLVKDQNSSTIVSTDSKKVVSDRFNMENQREKEESVPQRSACEFPEEAKMEEVIAERRTVSISHTDVASRLTHRCLEALVYGLQRFPQHYKSQYRLAHAYFNILSFQNVNLSRDLLLGSNTSGERPFNLSVQGLLNEKSKTNLFQKCAPKSSRACCLPIAICWVSNSSEQLGIWRIPLDDVDRPGSFCTHMYKSVKLLIDVLDQLQEWESLLLVSSLMYRCPDAGKKYLRDNERIQLASKAFLLSLRLLTERLQLCKQTTSSCSSTSKLLTDAYEAYKCSQKVQKHCEETEKLLLDVFKLSGQHKATSNENDVSLLDEALKYFQQQSKPQVSAGEAEEKGQAKIAINSVSEDPGSVTDSANHEVLQRNNGFGTPNNAATLCSMDVDYQSDLQASDSVMVSQSSHGRDSDIPSVFSSSGKDSQALPALIHDEENETSQTEKNS